MSDIFLVDDKHRKRLCVIPGIMRRYREHKNGMSIYPGIIALCVPALQPDRKK
ncbi:hypothetical protein EBL_c37840 [Shimwellia blattae DSM 4481 = NBRC 105725]|uniref:Uncharacterized protein n=1 Tax=Shimwellia blattae (strain ATCC 29907 / DSM 4481 / JCM 1650 / NBRC 105725 / CDC 9005-74) TaxID=630626 RepID=I2BE69_SHIBC|nr:hypothetical protein EBL_c37840 [Shimwellia blattae DSM 4481 = NBRC 105725]